jgi:hypothetical protein
VKCVGVPMEIRMNVLLRNVGLDSRFKTCLLFF